MDAIKMVTNDIFTMNDEQTQSENKHYRITESNKLFLNQTTVQFTPWYWNTFF